MHPPPLWLAIHETGHAVAHAVLNAKLVEPETVIASVSIDTDTGICRYRYRGDLDPRRHAVRCLSGYVAEMIHLHGPAWCPVDGQLTDVPAIVPDVQMAQDAVAALLWPEMEVLKAWAAAHDLVMEHWPALVRVAGVLQSRLSMTGAEFAAAWHGRLSPSL
jgi:hypothetical protein